MVLDPKLFETGSTLQHQSMHDKAEGIMIM